MQSQSASPQLIADKEMEQGGINRDDVLRQVMSNVSLNPSDFERLYLSPKNQVAGDLRKRFANPTPVALLGFSVGLTPLSMQYMGWQNTGSNATATTSCTLFFGGILLYFAGIAEFFLGNSFPFIVFMGYGSHFLVVATTFIPWFNAIGFYNTSGSPADVTPKFLDGFGFYFVSLALLSFVFLVGSIRTNAVFVLIFICATTGFGCAAGFAWHSAAGNMVLGGQLLVTVGVLFFVASLCGWYLFLAEMIALMELPIPDLPVGDLSTVVPARPRKMKKE